MLSDEFINQVISRLPGLHIGVVGDLFLDRYFDIDGGQREVSVETGLPAYQVTKIRRSPGAAGTVLNNLSALGVGTISILSIIGDDGEGYELVQELNQRKIDQRFLIRTKKRSTPTYTKPILHEEGKSGRELNRLDIRTREPMDESLQAQAASFLDAMFTEVDAILVMDQIGDSDQSVVTHRIRERLAALGRDDPDKLILADSRANIGEFRDVWLKPNEDECRRAVARVTGDFTGCVNELADRAGRPVFCTRGESGIMIARPGDSTTESVPAYPVDGPTDIVGAGDSTSAALACALSSGLEFGSAAAFANLIASITVQQIGTTGTATPRQIQQRWEHVKSP